MLSYHWAPECFRTLEIGRHIVVAPALPASLSPRIELAWYRTGVLHAIDARGAAQSLSGNDFGVALSSKAGSVDDAVLLAGKLVCG